MSARLKQIVSWWFILQIVLPFTAPLQTLELHDLFGGKHHRALTSSPESTTTPTISEVSSTSAAVPLLTLASHDALAMTASVALSSHVLRASADALLPSPQVQRSVLRL